MVETEMASGVGASLSSVYNQFISIFPEFIQQFISFFLIVLLIVLYAVFIWNLYRFVAKKDLIKLNLNKYNTFEHPTLGRFFGAALYFLEYILILPLLVFIWFSVFTLFLIFLTENLDVGAIILISATVIAAIRVVAYYNNDLSKDLAKLLPLTLLGLAITKTGFFSIERIFSHFSRLPDFFSQIFYYLIFIIILEIILRIFDLFFSTLGLQKKEEETEENSN